MKNAYNETTQKKHIIWETSLKFQGRLVKKRICRRMLGNHGKETGWLDVFERKLEQQTRKKCDFSKNTKLGKLFHWKQTLWKFPFPRCFHCHSIWISCSLCELSAFIFVLLFPSLSYLCEFFCLSNLFYEFLIHWNHFRGMLNFCW